MAACRLWMYSFIWHTPNASNDSTKNDYSKTSTMTCRYDIPAIIRATRWCNPSSTFNIISVTTQLSLPNSNTVCTTALTTIYRTWSRYRLCQYPFPHPPPPLILPQIAVQGHPVAIFERNCADQVWKSLRWFYQLQVGSDSHLVKSVYSECDSGGGSLGDWVLGSSEESMSKESECSYNKKI